MLPSCTAIFGKRLTTPTGRSGCCAPCRTIIPRGSNPAALVQPYPEKKRERYLSPDELSTLLEKIDAKEMEGTIDRYAAAAIRLLIFAGCRVSEIMTLEWASVDLDDGKLVLERHKTDQNGAKIIPLNAPALDIMKGLPREENNPYVIVGRNPGTHLINLQQPWRALCKATGLHDVRLHDLENYCGTLS